MYTSKTLRVGLAAALSALMLTTAPAAQAAQGVSASERINFSGKLRMLSQRIAAAGCNYNAGVNTDVTRGVFLGASTEFRNIIEGLEHGSADLNILGAEKAPATLEAIHAVYGEWDGILAAVQNILTDNKAEQAQEHIDGHNMQLLGTTKSLVKVIVGQYAAASDGGDNLGPAIDMAGRQRMLTQKMSKEVCQIWSGDTSPEAVEALQGTIALFDSSLLTLRKGDDAAGIAKAPNKSVKEGLQEVWNEWKVIKPVLEAAVAGEVADMEGRAEMFGMLNVALKKSNDVVGRYVAIQNDKGNVQDFGETERVNFSGKLRMLSQRMAQTACNCASGVDVANSHAMLGAAQTEFRKIASALTHGDADLRIRGAETRRKTLEALDSLNAAFAPMDEAVNNIVAQKKVKQSVAVVRENNMQLLDAAKFLVGVVQGQYSDPSAMTQANALLVNYSGRQRMLTQKMSKEACFAWSGDAAASEALAGTMQMFETSLLALRDGMPAAGVNAAPTEAIRAGLEDIYQDWLVTKPMLEKAVAGEKVDKAKRAEVFQRLNVALKEMNDVVGLYTKYAKNDL